MTSPPPMPLRGEPGAPSFNPLQLHDLKLYFCDLEYLFMHSGIKYSAQQKFYATYFVNPVTWELWESLPQYADPSSHFDTFRIAILHLYPEINDIRHYQLADLEKIIEDQSHCAIESLSG